MNGVWLSRQYCARFFLTTSDLPSNYLFVGDIHTLVPSTTRLEQHLLSKSKDRIAACQVPGSSSTLRLSAHAYLQHSAGGVVSRSGVGDAYYIFLTNRGTFCFFYPWKSRAGQKHPWDRYLHSLPRICLLPGIQSPSKVASKMFSDWPQICAAGNCFYFLALGGSNPEV